jgi:hypothetical protein
VAASENCKQGLLGKQQYPAAAAAMKQHMVLCIRAITQNQQLLEILQAFTCAAHRYTAAVVMLEHSIVGNRKHKDTARSFSFTLMP